MHGETNGDGGGGCWCFFYGHRHPMRAEKHYLVAPPKNACGLERRYEVRPRLETYLRRYQRGKDTCTHLSTHTRSCFSFPAAVQNAEQRWRERPSENEGFIFFYFYFFLNLRNRTRLICVSSSPPSKPSI